ncbi:MAG: InlB B-repeat-containing protein [Johnsonella sp.]|nr:InlB B-repeat-containing protein [Johnsonella sp.]
MKKKTGIRTGIAVLFFISLFAMQSYADMSEVYRSDLKINRQIINSRREWDLFHTWIKSGIPLHLYPNGGKTPYGSTPEHLTEWSFADGTCMHLSYPVLIREGFVPVSWSIYPDKIDKESRRDEYYVFKQRISIYDLMMDNPIPPINLYMYWAEDKSASGSYLVNFHPMGGNSDTVFMYTNEEGKLPFCPTPDNREGYDFAGWRKGRYGDSSNLIDQDTVYDQNTELYAVWIKKDELSLESGTSDEEDNWIQIDDSWKYIVADRGKAGFAKSCWKQIGAEWYYFDADGKMLTGWQQINGSWYYFYPNSSSGKPAGSMAFNTSIGGWKLDVSGKWAP